MMRSISGRVVALGATVAALTVGLTSAVAAAPHTPTISHQGSAPAQQALKKSLHPPARTELIYVPITACRIVNTSKSGGKIPSGHARSFHVRGSAGFGGQGGKACGIPTYARAVSASVTVPSVSGGAGHFTAYPTGQSAPNATAVSYPKKSTVTTGQTLKLGSGASEPSLRLRNSGHAANVIVDVTGYYVEQLEGMVGSGGTVYAGNSSIVSATNPSVGYYTVTFDRDVTFCSPMVNTYTGPSLYGSAYAFNGNTVTVSTGYINSSTHLPVAANYYFYISVSC